MGSYFGRNYDHHHCVITGPAECSVVLESARKLCGRLECLESLARCTRANAFFLMHELNLNATGSLQQFAYRYSAFEQTQYSRLQRSWSRHASATLYEAPVRLLRHNGWAASGAKRRSSSTRGLPRYAGGSPLYCVYSKALYRYANCCRPLLVGTKNLSQLTDKS